MAAVTKKRKRKSESGSASAPSGAAIIRSKSALGGLTVAESTPIRDRGSTFIAIVAFPVNTSRDASRALASIRDHSSIASADARVSAYISGQGDENCDDGGEDRAGKQLLIALRKLKIKGAACVVGRWWNGNIGKARFQHIRERASSLLIACGAGDCGGNMSQAVWIGSGSGHSLSPGQRPAASNPSNQNSVKKQKQKNALPESPLSKRKRRAALHYEAVRRRFAGEKPLSVASSSSSRVQKPSSTPKSTAADTVINLCSDSE